MVLMEMNKRVVIVLEVILNSIVGLDTYRVL